MKYPLLMIITFILFSCTGMQVENGLITRKKISFKTTFNEKIKWTHIYFEDQENRSGSFGIIANDISGDATADVFPGIYDIYLYGLAEKTSSSYCVNSYLIMKDTELFRNMDINYERIALFPEYGLFKEEGKVYLKIRMEKIRDILSLSSLSVKQNTDRLRSLSFTYDEGSVSYIAEVPLFQNGPWLMNASYAVKSKIDDDRLSAEGISISTSAFKDIPLGDQHFIE